MLLLQTLTTLLETTVNARNVTENEPRHMQFQEEIWHV